MDITKIRYFSVVAETGSVRKAAELMHLSPPALSRAIKQLEEERNVKLFVPSGRGIAITDQGRLLQQRQPIGAQTFILNHHHYFIEKRVYWEANP